ncbi:MAG TPA: MmcB family DNA repair protein [Xanthobacteraceae bacterium]|nr:MmcB family DNA repair protein [Xanthobacteraceae bacterium]
MPLGAHAERGSASAAVARGTTRLLHALGCTTLSELRLPSGRRADIVALGRAGELWIVEIKSSVEDFRADHKWAEYRAHCDRLFFATAAEVPVAIFPATAGLIVADRFGGQLVREAPGHRLPAATRRAMTLRFARAAAYRLQALLDPSAMPGETSADLFGAVAQEPTNR